MRILFTDSYGETQMFDNEDDFLQHCDDEEIDFDYAYGGNEKPAAWYIPDDLKRVNVEAVPSRYVIKTDPDSTEIPAPLPGETVSDYARRISGG